MAERQNQSTPNRSVTSHNYAFIKAPTKSNVEFQPKPTIRTGKYQEMNKELLP